jgi:hypothetical protein
MAYVGKWSRRTAAILVLFPFEHAFLYEKSISVSACYSKMNRRFLSKYTVNKGKCFCTFAEYGLTYDGWFPQQWEEYFYCHPQRFLHQIDRGSLPSTRRAFFPAYRMGIGKNSDMVGKIPPWKWTWSEKFPHGRKNSHIVGKIPTWSKKRQEGVHEGIINQVILFKFPYMRTLIICWPCPGHMLCPFLTTFMSLD